MTVGPAAIRCVSGLLVCAALLGAGAARADGWLLQLEPGYSAGTTRTTAAGGEETRTEQTSIIQNYRLVLDKTLLPLVSVSASGQYGWILGSRWDGQRTTDTDFRRWDGIAQLRFGPPLLSGTLSYQRRETDSSMHTRGTPRLDTPALIGETYSGNLSWHPLGMPALDLLGSRTETHDAARATEDRISNEVGVNALYREIKHFDFRGSVRYTNPVDRLHGTETRDVSEGASVLWDDAFWGRRVTASAGYSISHRDTEVTSSRPDAEILTQRFPFEGLSLVEPPIADVTKVTLDKNRALVDGDVTSTAGLDIGPAARVSGDVRFREMGVGFADARNPVNLIHVYVDRQLPAEVWRAFTWSAYVSNDNVTWTQVAVDRAGISFGTFDNRFEIPIARTTARYVKLVTAPLLAGVTTSPDLASILVTELKVFESVPAAQAVGRSSDTSGTFNGSVRALLERSYNLAYDGGVFVRHGGRTGWSTLSGLSAGRRLGAVSSWSARVDRTDAGDVGGDHTGVSRASLSLASDPLPTLGGLLSGGAQLTESPTGTSWSTTTSALAHADLYSGVSISGNSSVGLSRSEAGQRSRFAAVATSATVVPHQTTAFNGNYTLQMTRTDAAGAGWDRRSRIDGSASFTPFPALSASASVARNQDQGKRPTTLASFNVNASPLQGGDLVLRFNYTESLDTADDSRLRQWGPGLRLIIRPGSNLDVSYTAQTTRTGALTADTRAFFANLVVTLR